MVIPVRGSKMFDEPVSLFFKPGTIRTDLSLAASRHWPIHQLDVKNAFLHGYLSEIVYMHQPPGFRNSKYPDQGLFLSQKKYAIEILEKAHMVSCNPSRTHVDIESKLGVDGDPVSDLTLYRSLAGSLQYLTFTRSDISYAVQQVCLHMHDPREPHLSALKRILRYVQGTLNYGLQLFSSSTIDLVAYSDADWASCPTTRRSTLGAEAEYRGVANVVVETCWLGNLLRELHTPLSSATLVYCDNVSAVYLSSNPVQHQRTKHIEIDIHFVRDLVATGQLTSGVPRRSNCGGVVMMGLLTLAIQPSGISIRDKAPIAAFDFHSIRDDVIAEAQGIGVEVIHVLQGLFFFHVPIRIFCRMHSLQPRATKADSTFIKWLSLRISAIPSESCMSLFANRMSSKLPRLPGVPLFVNLQFDPLPSNERKENVGERIAALQHLVSPYDKVMLLKIKEEDDKTIGQAFHTISRGIHEKGTDGAMVPAGEPHSVSSTTMERKVTWVDIM
ncbi:ribonuclease H-like domain-containing protein [Tanacetum coccineum]|uniref:Ribonuclease H-like domain-containing protein n=1 Tax=Tanacetum coccineum TaxID=301880 RepID=A0ABQ5J3F7_9ASTR